MTPQQQQFKKAIAYKQKHNCTLKEAFAAVKKTPKKVGAFKFVEANESKESKPNKTLKVTRRKDGTFENFKKITGTFSAYTIHWFILMPSKGKCSIKDRILANKILHNYSKPIGTDLAIFDHSASYENAKSKILKLQNKLSKKYYGYIVTDKQFGLSNKDGDLKIFAESNNNKVKLTELQKQNVILV